MGGGALGSKSVSKLGSKGVSKRLRNFIPRPYDGRGCHGVTGESQIAEQVRDDKYRHGFTLAEVLITLGIIGIVAAITLFSLVQKYQEKVLIHQLQTAYSLLDNATSQMLTEEQTTIKDFGETPAVRFDEYQNKLQKYLKVSKVCQAKPLSKTDCNPHKIKKYYEDTGSFRLDNYDTITQGKTFVLADGIKIIFNSDSGQNCALYKNFTYDNSYDGHGTGTYGWACGSFYVDINGDKNPNTVGKDIFLFYIVKNGIIPAGMPQEGIWCQKFSSGGKYKYDATTAWVLFNKNMDYLKCSGLSWEGKHTCK